MADTAAATGVTSTGTRGEQYLELGVPNLLLPMIDTPEEAESAVNATRSAPTGVRGMGSGIGRSSRWGRFDDDVSQAGGNIGVIVQIENRTGLANAAAIAAVDGVDGVLFGPADLSADFGLAGQANHPDVVAALVEVSAVIRPQAHPRGSWWATLRSARSGRHGA